jgi:hypothetical protein
VIIHREIGEAIGYGDWSSWYDEYGLFEGGLELHVYIHNLLNLGAEYPDPYTVKRWAKRSPL